MRDSSMYNTGRIYITILLHLLNLKAIVTIKCDDQPIDMSISPHMLTAVTNKI